MFNKRRKGVAPRQEEEKETGDGVPLRMGVAPPWASVAHCRPRVAVAATQPSSKQPTVLLCNKQPGKELAPLRLRLVLGCSLVTAVICAVKHLGAVQLSAAGDKSEADGGGGGAVPPQ